LRRPVAYTVEPFFDVRLSVSLSTVFHPDGTSDWKTKAQKNWQES